VWFPRPRRKNWPHRARYHQNGFSLVPPAKGQVLSPKGRRYRFWGPPRHKSAGLERHSSFFFLSSSSSLPATLKVRGKKNALLCLSLSLPSHSSLIPRHSWHWWHSCCHLCWHSSHSLFFMHTALIFQLHFAGLVYLVLVMWIGLTAFVLVCVA
jgi:hypothetical protein